VEVFQSKREKKRLIRQGLAREGGNAFVSEEA